MLYNIYIYMLYKCCMHQGDGFYSQSRFPSGQDPDSTGHVVILVVNADEGILDLRVPREANII
jgi:hypothetical protein